MRLRHIAISGLSGSTTFFPRCLIKDKTFEGKKLWNIKCVWIFSTTFSEIFIILRRNEQDMTKNVQRSSCKVPVILVKDYGNLNFLDKCSQKKYSNITIS